MSSPPSTSPALWPGLPPDPLAPESVLTTLVKWNPFRELDLMERRVRRMFEDVGFAPAPLPAADVYETESEFVLELEVPG